MVCTQADGGVGGQLLDAVGQLGSHALQCTVVRLVAGVTGIHFHWSEPQLPASHAACLLRSPGTIIHHHFTMVVTTSVYSKPFPDTSRHSCQTACGQSHSYIEAMRCTDPVVT